MKAFSRSALPNLHGINLQKVGGGATIAMFVCIMILPTTAGLICVTSGLCAFGYAYSSYLHDEVLRLDTGTQEMRDVSDPIRSGAEG